MEDLKASDFNLDGIASLGRDVLIAHVDYLKYKYNVEEVKYFLVVGDDLYPREGLPDKKSGHYSYKNIVILVNENKAEYIAVFFAYRPAFWDMWTKMDPEDNKSWLSKPMDSKRGLEFFYAAYSEDDDYKVAEDAFINDKGDAITKEDAGNYKTWVAKMEHLDGRNKRLVMMVS